MPLSESSKSFTGCLSTASMSQMISDMMVRTEGLLHRSLGVLGGIVVLGALGLVLRAVRSRFLGVLAADVAKLATSLQDEQQRGPAEPAPVPPGVWATPPPDPSTPEEADQQRLALSVVVASMSLVAGSSGGDGGLAHGAAAASGGWRAVRPRRPVRDA